MADGNKLKEIWLMETERNMVDGNKLKEKWLMEIN